MRLLAAIPLSLLAAASVAATRAAPSAHPGHAAQGGEIRVDPAPTADVMNNYTQSANCTPISRQVSGEDRRYPGTRLDQEPAGRLMEFWHDELVKPVRAIDHEVNGCHRSEYSQSRQEYLSEE